MSRMIEHGETGLPRRKIIRVLVVDDSRTMRQIIRACLEKDPQLEVIAEASGASEARDAINAYSPDVMTLDVEMPKMNGLEFLKRVMRHRPMPVIMVSSMTQKGSKAAIAALANGAVECVEKPCAVGSSGSFAKLPALIKVAAVARTGQIRGPISQAAKQRTASHSGDGRYVFIGGSTGAVEAIERILLSFPPTCPPTLITQHMPKEFLASFAARLNPRVEPMVKLAQDGESLESGKVLIAPGGDTHLAISGKGAPRVSLVEAPERNGHRPSVDILFESAASLGSKAVGAILTGMGNDGAAGLLKMKAAGSRTVAQSEDSCVVFGMPRVAGEYGAVEHWCDIDAMASYLLHSCWENTGRS